MKAAASIACFFAFAIQQVLPQATVRGHIYSTAGQPIQGAAVVAVGLDFGNSGSTPWTHTDAWGRYSLLIPFSGNVGISATTESSKSEAPSFFVIPVPERKSANIQISPGHRVFEVNLHITPSHPKQ